MVCLLFMRSAVDVVSRIHTKMASLVILSMLLSYQFLRCDSSETKRNASDITGNSLLLKAFKYCNPEGFLVKPRKLGIFFLTL